MMAPRLGRGEGRFTAASLPSKRFPSACFAVSLVTGSNSGPIRAYQWSAMTSVKKGLDCEWSDPAQKADALQRRVE